MNVRSILIVLATAPVAVASLAQTPPAQPQTPPAQAQAPAPGAAAAPAGSGLPAVPPHNCVAPAYPGKNAPDAKIKDFNATNKAYGDCIRKYVDNVRTLANSAIQSGNDAVTEYNKFTEEVKKQIDADK